MNKKVAVVLIVVAISLIAFRLLLTATAEYSDDHSWLLTVNVDIKASDDQSARVYLKQPYETERIRVNQRTLHHAGLQQVYRKTKGQTDRDMAFRPRGSGEHSLSVQYALQTSVHARFYNTKETVLTEKDREIFTAIDEEPLLSELMYQEINDQLDLENMHKDELPDQLLIFLYNLPIMGGSNGDVLPNARLITLEKLTILQKAMVMVELCRKLNIPARLVTGFVLKDDPDAQPTWWVEVYQENAWTPYSPETGSQKSIPSNYIALDKTGQGIVTHKNLDSITWSIEIEELPKSAIHRDSGQKQWQEIFNVARLPADVREQLMLLALLPLGALITTIVREFVGVRSYGVFTPTMLALAMIYTSMSTTLIVLLVIAIAVYIGKPAMHPEISRTPRLSIVFVFVAISMLLGVSILEFLGFATDGHLVLLPIVILTSLVDRFLLTMEKEGQFIALYRLFWTSVISLMIIPVLGYEWLGYQLLSYPEVHLVTVAFLLLMADYKGTKVIDNRYLKLLSENSLKSRFS